MGFLFWVVADNAPVTRAFIIASALFTVFFGIQGRSAKLGLSYLVLFFFFLYISFVCDLIFSVHVIFDQFIAFSDVIVSGFILFIYFFFCFSGSSLNWGL